MSNNTQQLIGSFGFDTLMQELDINLASAKSIISDISAINDLLVILDQQIGDLEPENIIEGYCDYADFTDSEGGSVSYNHDKDIDQVLEEAAEKQERLIKLRDALEDYSWELEEIYNLTNK